MWTCRALSGQRVYCGVREKVKLPGYFCVLVNATMCGARGVARFLKHPGLSPRGNRTGKFCCILYCACTFIFIMLYLNKKNRQVITLNSYLTAAYPQTSKVPFKLFQSKMNTSETDLTLPISGVSNSFSQRATNHTKGRHGVY